MSKLLDKDKIHAFWESRTSVENPRLATNYRDDGRLRIDVALVREHLKENATILDLGAGTCTLASELFPFVKRIVAVEKFAGFLESADDVPKLEKVCSDVTEFQTNEKFDAILLFGVVNFLTNAEAQRLYSNCARMLTEDGVLIVKHQCGVKEEIVVDKYSDELQTHYNARYPSVGEERALLQEHFQTEVIDVYPAEINRWENTHFYAYVCRMR